MKDTLYLLDGHSYIYRAFFGVRGLNNSKGLPTNATFGFTKMILNILQKKKPKYMVACFDSNAPVEKAEGFDGYKANRDPMPEDLQVQLPFIFKIVESFNIPICMRDGIEADDLIASYVTLGKKEKLDVTIITGDKDLMQLVDDEAGVVMWDTMKDKIYDRRGVKKKLGVFPETVSDLFGLMGDSSDNIPGVKGVGPKIAVAMLDKYPTLEGIYEHLEEIAKGKILEKMLEDKENAFISRELAKVHMLLELPHTELHHVRLQEPNYDELGKMFEELEFKNMYNGKKPEGLQEKEEAEIKEQAAEKDRQVKKLKLPEVEIIDSKDKFESMSKALEREALVSFDTETDGVDSMTAGLIGLSLATEDNTYYIPSPGPLKDSDWLKLFDLLNSKRLIAHNAKFDLHIIPGIKPKELFDTFIAAYILDPEARRYKLKDVADKYLGENKHSVKNYEEFVDKRDPKEIPVEEWAKYSGDDARFTFELKSILEKKLKAEDLYKVATEIEMPLIPILTQMEKEGILVDKKKLDAQGKKLKAELQILEKQIYEMAGKEFNIASPAQLQEILFDTLKLTATTKTKTGFSTNEKVLKELSTKHEMPKLILEYRHLAKLLSTYVEALPTQINPNTGRVHTNYNQTGTATGRLSSNNPNLQNIPIRSDHGAQIREAFVPEKGYKIAALDYSQIELRILAHETKEAGLIKAFKEGKDIHAITASIILEKPENEVTREERGLAKTINFGLMYGMGPFKLAAEVGISRSEAREFIEKYFKALPKVKEWKENFIVEVAKLGWAKTLFGRKRYFPDMGSKHQAMVEAAKREAVNFVFQGANADVIKLAMIKIGKYIKSNKLKSRMLLQVHDELVFEIHDSETKHIDKFKEIMEGVIKISVPIEVDVGIGDNWLEAH